MKRLKLQPQGLRQGADNQKGDKTLCKRQTLVEHS